MYLVGYSISSVSSSLAKRPNSETADNHFPSVAWKIYSMTF